VQKLKRKTALHTCVTTLQKTGWDNEIKTLLDFVFFITAC